MKGNQSSKPGKWKGMEIPCTFWFSGDAKSIDILKQELCLKTKNSPTVWKLEDNQYMSDQTKFVLE